MTKVVERISVQDLINKYNKATSKQIKDSILEKSVIITPYVPYLTKVAYAKQLMITSHFTKEGLPKLNLSKQYLLETITLLDMYTNIEVIECEDKPDYIYDVLNQYGLIVQILSLISEDELKEWKRVLDLVYSSFYEEHFSINSCINKNFARIYTAGSKIITTVMDEAEKTLKNVNLEDVLKKIDK